MDALTNELWDHPERAVPILLVLLFLWLLGQAIRGLYWLLGGPTR